MRFEVAKAYAEAAQVIGKVTGSSVEQYAEALEVLRKVSGGEA